MPPLHITGLGAVTPAGWGIPALRHALQRGRPLPTTPLERPGLPTPLAIRRVPPPPTRPRVITQPPPRRTSPPPHYTLAAPRGALGPTPPPPQPPTPPSPAQNRVGSSPEPNALPRPKQSAIARFFHTRALRTFPLAPPFMPRLDRPR